MGTYTSKLKLYKVDPIADANQTFNIQTMLNDNWDKLDAGLSTAVEEATKTFDALATAKGNTTTDTLTTDPVTHLDTWTSIVTDSAGHEVARKVDVEGVQADGKAQWTTTITIGAKVVTVTDKETANGWTREVR